MKMTRILTPLAIAVSALVGAPQALADFEAGDVLVRIGASYVDPDDDSRELRSDGVVLPDFVGSDFDIDGDSTWNFSAAMMIVDHWALEFIYVGETDHDFDVDGFRGFDPDRDLKLANPERTSSTVFVDWYPVCQESWVQPYVGLGFGYTDFDDDGFTISANDYFARNLGATGPGNLSVKDEWGWAGQVGVDLMLGRDSNWLVNAAIQYMDAETTAYARFPVDGTVTRLRAGVDFDPWIYNLGIGYKF